MPSTQPPALPIKATACSDLLLLFTRYPEAGCTKTRLIPKLGAEGAAHLQGLLTEKIMAEARLLTKTSGIPTFIHYAGGNEDLMRTWLGPATYIRQIEGDLGLRMQKAFAHAFAAGAKKAVLVGSDIPGITSELLARAFGALETATTVIGPCRDGGYYLIGMQAGAADNIYPLVFSQMIWSTPEVFSMTHERLTHAGHTPTILPILRDIDTPEDLDLQILSSGV